MRRKASFALHSRKYFVAELHMMGNHTSSFVSYKIVVNYGTSLAHFEVFSVAFRIFTG